MGVPVDFLMGIPLTLVAPGGCGSSAVDGKRLDGAAGCPRRVWEFRGGVRCYRRGVRLPQAGVGVPVWDNLGIGAGLVASGGCGSFQRFP